ncbi:hypothetical protein MMC25_006018 [Agyrium rufum]|nr:hypothetical protein [Agyrium rufum]
MVKKRNLKPNVGGSSNVAAKSAARARGKLPPGPYTAPPAVLEPFLDTLDSGHVYVVHVDSHSKESKRQIFLIPVLMNVVLTMALIWRATYAIPQYIEMIRGSIGTTNVMKDATTSRKFWMLGRRTLTLFIDFLLARFLVPWPMNFFLGYPACPTSWRWHVRFEAKEVVVRVSRIWDTELPKDWLDEESEGSVYQERIMPALDKAAIRKKTGYLMLDKSWDLDYHGMIQAHELIRMGKAGFSDFEKMVIVYSEDLGWLVWQVWKLDEGAEDESREKIVMLKDELTKLGKEDLFYRWVELMQYETTQPGGFNEERQKAALEKAKDLFSSQDVDFDELWKKIGGDEAKKVPAKA